MISVRWFWTGIPALFLVVVATLALGQGRPAPIRVDTFDTKGNRTGYVIVDPKSGRVDFFDVRSNRTGSGQVTPAPATSSGTPKSGTTGPSAPAPWSR